MSSSSDSPSSGERSDREQSLPSDSDHDGLALPEPAGPPAPPMSLPAVPADDPILLTEGQQRQLGQVIYDGAELTVLDAVVDTLELQADKHLSTAAVTACHDMATSWLPPGAREQILSIKKGRQILDSLCLPQILQIHMCPNDCIAFYDSPVRPEAQFGSLNRCPVCRASRWRTNTASEGKRKPAKVFNYAPLKHLVAAHHSIVSLQGLRLHDLCPEPNDNTRCETAETTRRWRDKVKRDPTFEAGGHDNLVLQYSTDGIPFFNAIDYSGWPMMSMDMTLDESVRHLPENMLFHGTVPGPRDPKSMNAYHDILVDDYIQGWGGFRLTFPRPMTSRVLLLNIVGDYPGLCKCCNRGSNGALNGVCTHCNQTCVTIAALQRTVTVPIAEPPPPLRTMEECERIGRRIQDFLADGKEDDAEALIARTGVRDVCPFARVPGFDTCIDVCLDLMHILYGIIGSHVFKVFKGGRLASMPTDPRIRYKWGTNCDRNRPASCRVAPVKPGSLPRPPEREATLQASADRRWDAKKEERKARVEQWKITASETKRHNEAHETLILPQPLRDQVDQMYINARAPAGVADGGGKSPFAGASRLKSHDWLTLTTWLAPHVLETMLDDDGQAEARAALIDLCKLLADFCKPSADCSDDAFRTLEARTRRILKAVEDVLPATERTIIFHIVLHLPRQLYWHGPLRLSWMYPYERFVGWVKRLTTNRTRPEASMMRMGMQVMYTRILADRYPGLSHPHRQPKKALPHRHGHHLPPRYRAPNLSSHVTRRRRQVVHLRDSSRRALAELCEAPVEGALYVTSKVAAGGYSGRCHRTSWLSEAKRVEEGTETGRKHSTFSMAMCQVDGPGLPMVPCYILAFIHVTFVGGASPPELVAIVRAMRPVRVSPGGVAVVRFPSDGGADSSVVGPKLFVKARLLGRHCAMLPVLGSSDYRAVVTDMAEGRGTGRRRDR
jgi:hypothetical protein